MRVSRAARVARAIIGAPPRPPGTGTIAGHGQSHAHGPLPERGRGRRFAIGHAVEAAFVVLEARAGGYAGSLAPAMDAVPAAIDPEAVADHLRALPGVTGCTTCTSGRSAAPARR